jgi:hypothetical protein
MPHAAQILVHDPAIRGITDSDRDAVEVVDPFGLLVCEAFALLRRQ